MRQTLVLGVGNNLQSDDAVGLRVIEELQKLQLPTDLEVINGGTGVLDLLDVLGDRQRVIIVDAVQGGGEPGDIYRFAPEVAEAKSYALSSIHQIGPLEMLALAKHLGYSPSNVVIFGVEPKAIEWGLDLSPEVAAAVPLVIDLVLQEAGRPCPMS